MELWSEAYNNVNTGQIGGKKNNSQKDEGGRKCMVSCTENHPLYQCNVFRNKSSAEKLKVVQKYNYCLNCHKRFIQLSPAQFSGCDCALAG